MHLIVSISEIVIPLTEICDVVKAYEMKAETLAGNEKASSYAIMNMPPARPSAWRGVMPSIMWRASARILPYTVRGAATPGSAAKGL